MKAEADDYTAQVERLPEAQNGVVQVILRLKPSAGLRGVLVTAEGAPVAGGTVAVSRSGRPSPATSLRDNRLEDLSRRTNPATSGAVGEFVLPSPPETGTVLGAADYGFGSASVQQVRDSGRLVLQPWGRIEGTFTRGGQPVAGQEFTLSMRDTGLSFDWEQYKMASDENGRFTFEPVPPGGVQIVRLLKTAPNSWTHSYGADVTVLPGQTAQVALGDSGATLTGRIRFETPPAEDQKLSLSGMLCTVVPPPPANLSAEDRRAYYQAPGGAMLRQVKTFAFSIADDGSWSVDCIPPGAYTLSIRASKGGPDPWRNPPVATGTVQVVVPEGATPQTQIVVDDVILRPQEIPGS